MANSQKNKNSSHIQRNKNISLITIPPQLIVQAAIVSALQVSNPHDPWPPSQESKRSTTLTFTKSAESVA